MVDREEVQVDLVNHEESKAGQAGMGHHNKVSGANQADMGHQDGVSQASQAELEHNEISYLGQAKMGGIDSVQGKQSLLITPAQTSVSLAEPGLQEPDVKDLEKANKNTRGLEKSKKLKNQID